MRRTTQLLLLSFLCCVLLVPDSNPSSCAEYFGGQWYIHWYNCCDNCEEEDPYCDGWTWQGGSRVQYCGSCGENSFGGKLLKQYDCVNCDIQTNCTQKVGKYNYPGLCWKWSMAFRGCCKKASSSDSYSGFEVLKDSFTFCGDSVCQEGEDVVSCPMDCCPLVNDRCSSSRECTPICCSEASCCLDQQGRL